MKVIRLTWLSQTLGQPAVAITETPTGLLTRETIPDGAVVFRVESPSAAEMIHAPTDIGGPKEVAAEGQRWIDRFLSRAITEPSMTEQEIADTFGPDRDLLATELLRLWSWIPSVDDRGQRSYPHLPMPGFLAALSTCAEFYRKPASDILRDWTFQEFVFNWRIASRQTEISEGDELTARVGIEH